MKKAFLIFPVVSCLLTIATFSQTAFIRINQVGYPSLDKKTAIVISIQPLSEQFTITNSATGKKVLTGQLVKIQATDWGGNYPYKYKLDFSRIQLPGKYDVKLPSASTVSINVGQYPDYQEDLLSFMRQQRCGYNPFLGVSCHQKDGKSFYAPFADGTVVDGTGGWHDAGDQLKYLITASDATARMLLAYQLEKQKFADRVDGLGRPHQNRIPDVLDEAKWGLDWIFKLHPAPDQLFHQVADDRDHRGFKLPDQDNADYGWGANSFRPIYFADGKPQGLGRYKSRSTGIANIAGRSSAAMAIAYRIWKHDLHDDFYAEKCLRASKELYAMGKNQEGYQQGNSFGAPYRYNENTWADDLEWAAAELFKATGQKSYLDDALRYAKQAGTTSWMEYPDSSMGPDMARHYERYPFTNIGHFSLYPLVDRKAKTELAGYYRSGIEKVIARGKENAFGIGVPFLWCSNNLVVAFITQVLLYERMTGDGRYHFSMVVHRDWLFGRNPWGTSMFTGIPVGGRFPEDVHLSTVQLLKKQVSGGLVDGPIAMETYKGLRGLQLTHPDEFADFQTAFVVYHDDVGDYSTNEPTMDGTADAILMMATSHVTMR